MQLLIRTLIALWILQAKIINKLSVLRSGDRIFDMFEILHVLSSGTPGLFLYPDIQDFTLLRLCTPVQMRHDRCGPKLICRLDRLS